MTVPKPKHSPSASWDGHSDQKAHHHNHQHSATDSFFNRVFGYHSSDSSRATSPIPSTPFQEHPTKNSNSKNTATVESTKKKSRHNRNSSTGQLPSNTTTTRERRRSFDAMNGSKLLLPMPVSTISTQKTNSRNKPKEIDIPFPRGGRQIGQTTLAPPIRRSNSIERSNNIRLTEDQQPRKRHLFRFGKKKNHPPPSTNSSSTSTASSNTMTIAPRKRSNDIEYKLANLDSASDIQRFYYQQQTYKEERKKSNSSNGSNYSRKPSDNGKDSLLKLRLDQNFDKMDGIVNKSFQRATSPGPHPTLTPNENNDLESWAPPDSWGVQPSSVFSVSAVEEDQTDFEDYQIEVQDKFDIPKKNANIKIYRLDKTYNTLHVALNTTTLEILKKLATKFFMSDIAKHNLVMKRHNIERILGLTERPLQIQKLLQEQMGYMDQDKIDDTTYLVRFQLMLNVAAPTQEDKEIGQHVDLQSRSLATIPIYLYKHASTIVSIDISKNLHIEVPLDFIQMCTSLKQLWLADNEYLTLPPSTYHISSLEHLNISGNRLLDLDHAQLHEISGLKTLRAINNRLETLPDIYATNFKMLTTLFISNNSFTKFPMVICEITSLEYLDISFNKIQMFPDEIGQLTNLIGLFAIANRITGALPASFSRLVKLQELDIRQNIITDLDVISHLPRLEMLFVDYNSTSIVNFEIKSLKQLKMCKNHLTQFNLTSSCGGSMCLTQLNLANCKLSSLPEDLFINIPGLERLVLDSNTLNSIPSSIGVLKKLVKLSIQNNNIDTLPSEIGKLSELRSLDAQKNNLKSLPQEIWLCSSLQTLNCSSNLLESFPEPITSVKQSVVASADSSCIDRQEIKLPEEKEDLMALIPPTLNAGQGVVQRLDRLLDYTNTPLGANQAYSLPSPITPPTIVNHQQDKQQQNDYLFYSPSAPPPAPPPNFNPPSFFASPRNHPPPLSLSLKYLYLGDNRLTDDIWSPLSLFLELRTLNLSFNDLYEIPNEGLCHQHLYELYLSGNQLTSLPADDIEKLQYLRVLAVNGNKLQTLPAEIGKLRKLLVLDVGNNVLKYNIANWPYDWNWNWNLGLKYLNLSGNKRLEIQKSHPDPSNNPKDKDLSDFSALTRLRMLGLMDITILGVSILEEYHDRRVRTSPSEVNRMSYGVADWLGPSDHLSTWDLVMPRFRGKDDECIFALFDGSKHPKSGCRLTKQLNDTLVSQFTKELAAIRSDDTIVSAIRRVFLSLEQNVGTSPYVDKDSGASAVVCYISGTKLYVANVGDALAVISRNNGQAFEITQKHIPLNPSEISRIRAAGGFVSNSGLLNNELNTSRSFGHFHLIPVVNCNPFVHTIELAENDEFVIIASRGLWDKVTYQTAVDIARTEKDDLMAAAQKLRDFAITYGANDNLMVMVIGVGDLFDKREKRYRTNRGNNLGPGRGGSDVVIEDGVVVKSKRRGKEEVPSDSTLARLEREVAPPISQLALVFTDIKSSTHFWETQPENMRSAIKIHDSIMRRTLRSVGGYEVKTEGDAFMVCFKNITAALLWCFTVQLQLLEADWPAGILDTEEGREIEKDGVVIYKGLSVRMGIHWGTPVFERNPITQRMDYFGPVVNKASRICNAADGGQICVSSDVIAALRTFPSMFDDDPNLSTPTSEVDTSSGSFPVSRDLIQLKQLGFHVVELGERRLKGLETPETLSLVYSKQLLGRIEVDKSQMMNQKTTSAENPTNELSPGLTTPSLTIAETDTTSSNSPSIIPRGSELSEPSKVDIKRSAQAIDPNLVCAMSNLAIRLERLTSGNILYQSMAGSSIHSQYTLPDKSNASETTISTAHSGLGLMLDRHIRQEATDEELLVLMENCVARVENAVSSLYLQKMDRFSGVLEKLGEAIDLDPMHIIKALQMYAEAASLTSTFV